ncbi:MAG: acyl-CoA/acyl-ACP dehydrogenase [Caldilineaceae bacterium]|nr:acyl-CoA/acyl-ACP dehydrogenase [Caldilineaceae bacterium]
MTTPLASLTELHSIRDGVFPHYPRTERQARFMALADSLAERAAARAATHDRAGTFPFDTFRDLHEAGYLALTVPTEYGGCGANVLEVALAQERLARGDGSVALAATMHLGHVGILAQTRSWSPEQFERLCWEVVNEGALINAAASEPDLGSPSRGGLPKTIATRTATGWRLNGRKSWTSLAPALRYFSVMAAVYEEGQAPRRASFLVRAGTPGLRIEETWDNLGMRATASHDIVLEDVDLPAHAIRADEGPRLVGDPRVWGIVSGAVYTGIATAARDFAVKYARERQPNSLPGPIAELQTIQHRIAEIELLLLQSRAVLYSTAEAWLAHPDQHKILAWQLAAAKYLATNNAIKVTDLTLRVVGSAGLSRTLPLERYFRDVRAGLGHPPMDDAALTAIGKAALGIS